MPLIETTVITYETSVTEEQLRARLANEVMEGLGLLRDGTQAPGCSVTVLRGDGRKGGYRVRITRDMTKDTTPRLTAEVQP